MGLMVGVLVVVGYRRRILAGHLAAGGVSPVRRRRRLLGRRVGMIPVTPALSPIRACPVRLVSPMAGVAVTGGRVLSG
ncbi:MAG: hypothetical protein HY554_18950 [Elusimicrobia bacterium]|nr:hypothetical protein [Elusimicrobiota bacterium]